ncbi:MAG: hypothetical protein JNM68_04205 [Dinghuibacter sp.]|nr:hypothetical protein [Dinghuibacter sp.]
MKLFTAFMALLFILFTCVSCAKEGVQYRKMPDNGNTQISCPDPKK